MISVECEQQLRPSTVQLTAPPCISESLFIITNVDDHDEEKRAEQNLFVHSGKSKAEVINNRRLRSTYFTIEANYLQPWSIITYAASCETATAELLVIYDWNVCWQVLKTTSGATTVMVVLRTGSLQMIHGLNTDDGFPAVHTCRREKTCRRHALRSQFLPVLFTTLFTNLW